MKPKIKLFLYLLPLILVGIFLAQTSQAQLITCGRTGNECELKDLVVVFARLINLLLGLSWIVAIFFVFMGGWEMINSSGNEEKIKAGKTTFTNAIIGFFLILASFLIVNAVISIATGSNFRTFIQFLPRP
jgi:hypothetical protein